MKMDEEVLEEMEEHADHLDQLEEAFLEEPEGGEAPAAEPEGEDPNGGLKKKPRVDYGYSRQKKRKVKFKIKMALLEIIERKRLTHFVDYKSIAARHGTTPGNLKQLFGRWKKGVIDMGEPESASDRQIDARVQHERAHLDPPLQGDDPQWL